MSERLRDRQYDIWKGSVDERTTQGVIEDQYCPPPLTPHPTTQWKQIAPTSVVLLEEKRLNRTKD